MIGRSESQAYPKTPTDVLSRLSYCSRQHSRGFVATLGFVAFVLILSLDQVQHSTTNGGGLRGAFGSRIFYNRFGGAVHSGYFPIDKSIVEPGLFRFAAVSDLDQLSHMTGEKKPTFKSILLPGTIRREPAEFNLKDTTQVKYKIEFEPTRLLTSKHNEAGRGMELSELTTFNDRLLCFDDRTGSVYEILNKKSGQESFVVPRFVITEGEGETDKGMKWEWATVKDGELYMGSFGKEYTDSNGDVVSTNNLWISILNARGELRREDWSPMYSAVRATLGAASPGYIIVEAVLWSSHLRKWVFLPRRISTTAYDENEDERRGSNKLVLIDEDFGGTPEVVEIKMETLDPLHGFSTFAFVPGTQDRHALAIRSVEENCVGGDEDACKQRSYFMIFDVTTGDVLLDEVQYEEEVKFEGVEFADIYTDETKVLSTK